MTPIEKQILYNQITIMERLNELDKDTGMRIGGKCDDKIFKTLELLNPTKKKEDACDMSEEKRK